MTNKRVTVLSVVLAFVVVALLGGWLAASRIESPADVALRTAAPTPSPILVPVEKRVLSSNVITRGTARFGLPVPISIAPSLLKDGTSLITTLPLRNAQIEEGGVLLTASGRPVFVLQGNTPAYRDLTPGISGEDVLQLEQALQRLGYSPGTVDGTFDERTSEAVTRWYRKSGWDPFGPTRAQLADLRTLETDLAEAMKIRHAAQAAADAAALSVESARATADLNIRSAQAELAARRADRNRLVPANEGEVPLAIETERAKAEYASTAANAEVAATIADRALVALDPRQPETARAAADARLDLARASAEKTKMESQLAIQAAEREVKLALERLDLAEKSVSAARLAGEMSIQAALDSQEVARLEAQLATDRAERAAASVTHAKTKIGVQVPVDEIVFLPVLPVRVEELMAVVGDPARGPVMSVTDNQLAVDGALPLNAAPFVKPGMEVSIDEQALGIEAHGVVSQIANTPGTRGVDGYHFYFEVRVNKTKTPLEGFSVRLTIPIESTKGEVIAVPLSAVSLAADGQSRIQVRRSGALHYIAVDPGLSADGFVEVTPVTGTLEPGELVVVGYESSDRS